MSSSSEERDAELIGRLLEVYEGSPLMRGLKIRIAELGEVQKDEVLQFRQLQRVCRESADLASAFEAAGFGTIVLMNPRSVDSQTGRVVQAFNRYVRQKLL